MNSERFNLGDKKGELEAFEIEVAKHKGKGLIAYDSENNLVLKFDDGEILKIPEGYQIPASQPLSIKKVGKPDFIGDEKGNIEKIRSKKGVK